MLDLILWLISAHVVALAAFPLVYRAFPALADRGWGLAMPLGMLITGVLMWLVTYTRLIPNAAWAWWIAVLIIAAFGIWLSRRKHAEMTVFKGSRWRAAFIAEALFLAFFLAFALLRANDPNIAGTEKPMEILMLNASMQAEHAPPEDPWLAGESVAYYYGGYWTLGGLSKLAGVEPGVAFNLSLALIAGMSASAIFSLVFSVTSRDGAPVRFAALAGITSSVALLLVANLAGWWELAANLSLGTDGFYSWLSIDGLQRNLSAGDWKPDQFWWWFRASRVINSFSDAGIGMDFTIQEFPAFSMTLGDLHPHVISIPFVIAGLATAYNLVVSDTKWGFGWIRSHPVSAAAVALVIGSAGFINQADVILSVALFFGAITIKAYRERGGNVLRVAATALAPFALIVIVGVGIFAPFYFGTLDGQIQSPPIAPVDFGTRPIHFLTVWGLFALLIAPFVIYFVSESSRPYFKAAISIWRSKAKKESEEVGGSSDPDVSDQQRLIDIMGRAIWLIPVALTVAPYFIWTITHLAFNDLAEPAHLVTRMGVALPLGVVFTAIFFTLIVRARSGANDGIQFVLLVTIVAVYLLYGAELFFVHDLFGNRMNTVFKFYYQAWIMLSMVSGYALFHWFRIQPDLKTIGMAFSRTAAVAFAVLLIGPLWYTVAATVSKAEDYTGPVTLNGWGFLEDSGDGLAIEWLQSEAEDGSRIVEAVGGGYSEFGRISAATGLPTVIGWPGHERQWRGPDPSFAFREGDVRRIYESADEAETLALLEKYEITYVVVGARERITYPSLLLTKFDSLGDTVFNSNGTLIYKVQGQQG